MKKYLNGKLYINTTELSSMFTKSYGFKVTPRDINHVCGHYKLPKQEFNNMIFYNATLVEQMRTMKEDFMYVLTNIVKYGDARGVDAYTNNVNKAVETDMNYEEPNASDMEYANNELLNKYQFENKKGKLVKITEEQRKRLFEDVFADKNLKNTKDKTVGLTYNNKRYNKGNMKSSDMLITDKMDNVYNSDTYEVPLKGGLNSYNIVSINGLQVMHYFKNKFSKSTNDATIKDGDVEWKLKMQDDEYNKFMSNFKRKVENVINYCIKQFQNKDKDFEINGVSVYPVPSSSNFNEEMATSIEHFGLCGLPTQKINSNILLKDLRNLKKDEEFIAKNKNYYDGQMSWVKDKKLNKPVNSYLDRNINKFSSLKKAQSHIEDMNNYAEKILVALNNYKVSGSKKTLESLAKLYMLYYDSMLMTVEDSRYDNPVDERESKIRFENIIKALKYSKGPSIEGRSGIIWNIIKPLLRGLKSSINNLPYKQFDVNKWEATKFQIKNLTNGERMGLMNYYSKNEDNELVQDELNKIKGTVFVIFDDNISGGATLSDICYQCKQMGIEYIIPITFGKMNVKYELNMIPLNQPTNDDGEYGKFNY